MREGIIKFDCLWRKQPLSQNIDLSAINRCRNRLYRERLIGVDSKGFGYGNISIRWRSEKKFIITGSQTESLKKLCRRHYSIVTGYSFQPCQIHCQGLVQASSESLTHAMLYEMNKAVGCVIHVHDGRLWRRLLHNVPTASQKAKYGSYAMALEIRRLYRNTDFCSRKIAVMAGHKEGILVFGANPQETQDTLKSYF